MQDADLGKQPIIAPWPPHYQMVLSWRDRQSCKVRRPCCRKWFVVRSIDSVEDGLHDSSGTDAAMPPLSTSHVSHRNIDVRVHPLLAYCVFEIWILCDLAGARLPRAFDIWCYRDEQHGTYIYNDVFECLLRRMLHGLCEYA